MATRGHIIGCGAYRHKGKSKQRFVLAVIDLDALQPKAALADMRFLGHGITIDPLKPDHAAVFEKKGKGACYVDLKKLEVVKRITTEKNQHFYGHGAYSADASLLYAAEALLDDAPNGHARTQAAEGILKHHLHLAAQRASLFPREALDLAALNLDAPRAALQSQQSEA